VIASTSTAHYVKGETIKQIGQELRCHYVLEGSINQQAQTYHVSARLIARRTRATVWGDEYDPGRQLFVQRLPATGDPHRHPGSGAIGADASVKPQAFHNKTAMRPWRSRAGANFPARAIRQGPHELREGHRPRPGFAAAYACAARACSMQP